MGGRADGALHYPRLCEFPLSAEEVTSGLFYDRLCGSVTAGKNMSVCDGHGPLHKVSASPDLNVPNKTQGEESRVCAFCGLFLLLSYQAWLNTPSRL